METYEHGLYMHVCMYARMHGHGHMVAWLHEYRTCQHAKMT